MLTKAIANNVYLHPVVTLKTALLTCRSRCKLCGRCRVSVEKVTYIDTAVVPIPSTSLKQIYTCS